MFNMNLNIDYNKNLENIISGLSQKTDQTIKIYSRSKYYYLESEQSKEYKNFLDNMNILEENYFEEITNKNISKSKIYFMIPNNWQKDVIQRTMNLHYKKLNFKESQSTKEFTKTLTQIIPFFILESLSCFPRMELFNIKNNKIQHYLKIPNNQTYIKLLYQ